MDNEDFQRKLIEVLEDIHVELKRSTDAKIKLAEQQKRAADALTARCSIAAITAVNRGLKMPKHLLKWAGKKN